MKKSRRLKTRFKKLLLFSFLSIQLIVISKFVLNSFADPIEYIYLDLNCDNISISATQYSGCVFKTDSAGTTSVAVTGEHNSNNHYYIYQSTDSTKATSGYVNGSSDIVVPTHTSMNDIVSQAINNQDVEEIILAWRTKANERGRTATANRITVTGNSSYDITIDNLYSSYQIKGTGRTSGGITVTTTGSTKFSLKLKGENRFGNVFYSSKANLQNELRITSADGDSKTTGSLIVANIASNTDTNYWGAGIGGNDGTSGNAYGIVIDGGTLYVGTTIDDNCTAIGGGGNDVGEIIINGGIITAVSNSTGSAIGGGIGRHSQGGNAYVTINNGIIYAYNTGQSYPEGYVPGVAIGGGSSSENSGNADTKIQIKGGTVYAQSEGGVAIGGGNSATKNGGQATIIISGDANVTANSTSGSYILDGVEYEIPSGSGIGGGTGGIKGNGGDATVTINGGMVVSGTIGGGETKNSSGTVGSATVKINGGTVNGRVLMHRGTFEMNDGILTGGKATHGGCVEMDSGTATVNGGDIKNCEALEDGGAIYIRGGEFYVNGGTITNNKSVNGAGIYLSTGTVVLTDGIIKENNATNNGGALYVGGGTFTVKGGNIEQNKSNNGGGVYLGNGTIEMTAGTVEYNESTNYGGGFYVEGGNFYAKGGNIEHNKSNNGGGVYLGAGTVEMTAGLVGYNESTNHGGGFYVANDASFTMDGGKITNNKSLQGNGGGIHISNGNISILSGIVDYNTAIDGGGIYISNGNISIVSGNIDNNQATNGGGFYLEHGTFDIVNGSSIKYNNATNGGGGYVVNGTFNLTGGDTSYNTATNKGGAYYIADTKSVALADGVVSNNQATNGGGFFLTQSEGNETVATLSGACYVYRNKAQNGNGGGAYIDGGATFRVVSGRLAYNDAVGEPSSSDKKSYVYENGTQTSKQMVYAKDSSAGVGGGIYIKKGSFTMKDMNNIDGTAAVFGNYADYAADDLFALGNGNTTFDAINVVQMNKDGAYVDSTDWYEDYPTGENHISLRLSDNKKYSTSPGRFKFILSENLLVKADSVLTKSEDYICITMGANIGTLIISIDDPYVGSDNTFVYSIVDKDENEIVMEVTVRQGDPAKVINVPLGNYSITLKDSWSWRYGDKFESVVDMGNETINNEAANSIDITMVGGRTITVKTKYNLINKEYYAKNLFSKVTAVMSTF